MRGISKSIATLEGRFFVLQTLTNLLLYLVHPALTNPQSHAFIKKCTISNTQPSAVILNQSPACQFPTQQFTPYDQVLENLLMHMVSNLLNKCQTDWLTACT